MRDAGGVSHEEYDMSLACAICGKTAARGNNVSHANNRRKRTFKPNLQRIRASVNGQPKYIRVCTDCIRSNKVEKAIRPSLIVD